jgi:hypothetical protein
MRDVRQRLEVTARTDRTQTWHGGGEFRAQHGDQRGDDVLRHAGPSACQREQPRQDGRASDSGWHQLAMADDVVNDRVVALRGAVRAARELDERPETRCDTVDRASGAAHLPHELTAAGDACSHLVGEIDVQRPAGQFQVRGFECRRQVHGSGRCSDRHDASCGRFGEPLATIPVDLSARKGLNALPEEISVVGSYPRRKLLPVDSAALFTRPAE